MPRISLSWALILGLLTAIGPLCTDFYLPALPDITRQLNATGTQTQFSLTAALIGLGLGQLFLVRSATASGVKTAGALAAAVYFLIGDVRRDRRYSSVDRLAFSAGLRRCGVQCSPVRLLAINIRAPD
jgi:MFS family permease